MILKNTCKFILTMSIAFYSLTTFSENVTPYKNNIFSSAFWKRGHLVFQFGANQGKIGTKQDVAIQDLIGDTFTSDNTSSTNVLLGLGYYLDGQDFGRIKMSYGINGFYLPKLTATGNVIQEGIFNNLSYSYQVANTPIYLMAKSTIDLNSPQYALTFDAGIGPNFMNAYAFEEQSLDGVTIPDSFVASHSKTNLSGTLGAGFKINHVGQLSMELGYRFFYLGQGYFTTTNDQVLTSTIKTGTIYTNAIVLSLIV